MNEWAVLASKIGYGKNKKKVKINKINKISPFWKSRPFFILGLQKASQGDFRVYRPTSC